MNRAIPAPATIRAATRFLARHLPRTPLRAAPALARRLGAPVLLKLETELPTGSFKPRGALWALHCALERRTVREVVAASTGNHGAAVAWAADVLGVAATIFLPAYPNPVKRARIAGLGARIVGSGTDLAAAAAAARAHAARTNAFLLDDATDEELPAGPATIAIEIFAQAPDTDVLFVPVGDTALIRGIAAVAKAQPHDVRVIGVQAATAPAYTLSWRAGRAVPTPTCDTIADGLATRTPAAANVDAIRALVDDMVLVTDDQLLDAMRVLLRAEQVVAEPAGAAATAAALAAGSVAGRAVLLVTGANVSDEMLERAATR